MRDSKTSKNIVPFPTATLTPISSTIAPITVTSSPSQAQVFLDGAEIGITPLALTNLSTTVHRLTLKKSGFLEEAVTFTPQVTTSFIHLNLQPIPATDGVATPLPTATAEPSETPGEELVPDVLERNDPQIPLALAGLVSVPDGYRFPVNPDITKPIPLEIIPFPVEQDAETKRMPITAKNELLARLRFSYFYNPLSQTIEPYQSPFTSLIDFGFFEPQSLSVPVNTTLSWYNQNDEACQLRSDPKSPQKFNQTIAAQSLGNLQIMEKGIYVFFCQGTPGPTQVISAL